MAKKPSPISRFPRLDRFNLVAAGATLVACLMVFIIILTSTSKAGQRRVHTEGKRLLRFLQTIPADNVSLDQFLATCLKTLPEDLEENSVVAYLVIRDPAGRVAARMAKPGITVPDQTIISSRQRSVRAEKSIRPLATWTATSCSVSR